MKHPLLLLWSKSTLFLALTTFLPIWFPQFYSLSQVSISSHFILLGLSPKLGKTTKKKKKKIGFKSAIPLHHILLNSPLSAFKEIFIHVLWSKMFERDAWVAQQFRVWSRAPGNEPQIGLPASLYVSAFLSTSLMNE